MLNFLGGVLIGSAIWVGLGAFLSSLCRAGSKAEDVFAGLAAFAAFCFLAAFAGSLVSLVLTIFWGS